MMFDLNMIVRLRRSSHRVQHATDVFVAHVALCLDGHEFFEREMSSVCRRFAHVWSIRPCPKPDGCSANSRLHWEVRYVQIDIPDLERHFGAAQRDRSARFQFFVPPRSVAVAEMPDHAALILEDDQILQQRLDPAIADELVTLVRRLQCSVTTPPQRDMDASCTAAPSRLGHIRQQHPDSSLRCRRFLRACRCR